MNILKHKVEQKIMIGSTEFRLSLSQQLFFSISSIKISLATDYEAQSKMKFFVHSTTSKQFGHMRLSVRLYNLYSVDWGHNWFWFFPCLSQQDIVLFALLSSARIFYFQTLDIDARRHSQPGICKTNPFDRWTIIAINRDRQRQLRVVDRRYGHWGWR